MKVKKRVEAFVKLGKFLSQFQTEKVQKKDDILFNDLFFEAFEMQINRSHEFNGWFTKENIIHAFESWSKSLNYIDLNKWISSYELNNDSSKTIGVIMAGNIPLVGFHDFLSVLISGNSIIVKQSSSDQYFLPLIAKYLEKIEPEIKGKIHFAEDKLSNFDAVIATGSNNTARYFDYYFGKYPHIIRQNRNSVAILTGKESSKDLELLGEDIFRYFGLGCRSVSKIFVPKNYDFDKLFKAIYPYKDIINYKKYQNNYDYNKAVYLMSQFKLIENGFLMLKEDRSYASPIASLFYEYYENSDQLTQKLTVEKEAIQCIVGNQAIENIVPFGETQKPQLWDYADGVDTLDFLQNL
ncbi:MAG: acyl-CoA reductase [Flavobacteriaceae bacterium]|nr:acyl-CoA reductase [Flavobacteriaceae bacterium]